MKHYPKIPSAINQPTSHNCIAFDKLDGSNLRWLWTNKKGWCRFGTRTRLFDATDIQFGPAVAQFLNTLADPLEQIIRKQQTKSFTIFTEWWGVNSFAGTHCSEDTMRLDVIDAANGEQLLNVYNFLELFAEWCPNIIYQGLFTEEFIQAVRNDEFNLAEGVVCKGVLSKSIWMCKIKTNKYRERLILQYGNDWLKYWET
jgi:hypothetical protein